MKLTPVQVKFRNNTQRSLTLSVEPTPDFYSVAPNDEIELDNLTGDAEGRLEVGLGEERGKLFVVFESLSEDEHIVRRNGEVIYPENCRYPKNSR